MKTFYNTFYGLLFLICTLNNTAFAQPLSAPVEFYNFINYKADTLYVAANSSSFQFFLTKLNSVVKNKLGNINIVHIGASHVQAGTFPHTVRQELRKAYPDLNASRGMIFPYAAAPNTNNPMDYRTRSTGSFRLIRNVYHEHQSPLGITGIAAYTLDSISEIKIVHRDSLTKFYTTKITLLGYSNHNFASIPILKIDTLSFLPTHIFPEKRQFIYENICVTDSFAFSFVNRDSTFFTITGILLENDNPGITYHSIGVNGASVDAFLRCEHFYEEIPLLHPDMVIFGLGINDASEANYDPVTYKANYLTLITQFKKVNPNCFFLFITNNDSYKKVGGKYQVNKNALQIRKIMYELANETGGAVFDQFEIMGGLQSMEKWRVAKLAQNDRIHFTKAGYELMGRLLFNAIIRELF